MKSICNSSRKGRRRGGKGEGWAKGEGCGIKGRGMVEMGGLGRNGRGAIERWRGVV